MGKLQGRGIASLFPTPTRRVKEATALPVRLRRALIIPEKSIPEKRVLYVRGKHIVAYQDSRIDADLTKRRNWIFTHMGLSVHELLCKRLKFTD